MKYCNCLVPFYLDCVDKEFPNGCYYNKKGYKMNEVNKVVDENVKGSTAPSEEGIPEFLQRENIEETKEVKNPTAD